MADAAHFNYAINPSFKKVCTDSGLEYAVLVRKRATFQDLANTLEAAIIEAETANADHRLYRRLEAVARTTQVIAKSAAAVIAFKAAAAQQAVILGIDYLATISELIVKATNEELRTRDALAFSGKTKLDSIEYGLSISKNATAQKVGKVMPVAISVFTIGNDILSHIEEYNQGGELNIATAPLRKKLRQLKQKVQELDEQIQAESACQQPRRMA